MIKAIIGLGNPGQQYYRTRHSIGFRIVDALAEKYGGSWRMRDNAEVAQITMDDTTILLVKPQTFMNSSGTVIPWLAKQGIGVDNILVVHDELELPFGSVASKKGGSHKGHNGLKSIIAACGPDFIRVRFGIGRPENRDDVPAYVLRPFAEDASEIEKNIEKAVALIEETIKTQNN